MTYGNYTEQAKAGPEVRYPGSQNPKTPFKPNNSYLKHLQE